MSHFLGAQCVIYKFYMLEHKIMIDEVEFLISYSLENRMLFLVNY